MKWSRKIGFVFSAALVLVITASLLAGGRNVSASCGPVYCWTLVSSPNKGSADNVLTSVYEITSSNIWSVGWYVNSSGVDQTLTENYNGTSWSIVSSPNQGSSHNVLKGVTYPRNSINPANVWAVGYYINTSSYNQTLIEKYDGTSWSIVSSPNQGSNNNELRGVATNQPSNAWAVGDYYDSVAGIYKTLVERWNGSSWSTTSSDNPGSNGNYLYSVSVVDNNDAWADGYYVDSSGQERPMLLEWNSTTSNWDNHSGDLPSLSHFGTLYSISFLSTSEGFAVGNVNDTGVVIFHYYSSSWHNESPTTGSYLTGVDYMATNSAMAVGYTSGGPISYYWDGTSWTSEGSASSDGVSNGVSGLSISDVWAVGRTGDKRTLIQHFTTY